MRFRNDHERLEVAEMSRVRFWTILIGEEPTSFRATAEETLIPTLKQLQRVHPQAVLRWFEAGRLWASPEEARHALREDRRPAGTRTGAWRPGGEHRDPRARYKVPRDVKRQRFAKRLRRQDERGPSDAPSNAGPGKPTRPRRLKVRGDAKRGPAHKKPGRGR
jgi:hypothetical protein